MTNDRKARTRATQAERAAERLRALGMTVLRVGVAGWSVGHAGRTWRLLDDRALCAFECGVAAAAWGCGNG